jgi:hypothetical protein
MEDGGWQQRRPDGAAAAPRLKPLDVGQKLDVAVKLTMREFWPLLKAVLVVLVPVTLVSVLITLSTLPDDFVTSGAFEPGATSDDPSAGFIVGQLFVQLLDVLSYFLAPLVCFKILAAAYLGERATWGESVRFAFKRFWMIVALIIVLAFAFGAAFVAGILVTAVGAAASPWLAVILGLGVVAGLIYLGTIWSLTFPALLLERIGIDALGRSPGLVRGGWWSTFATLLMAFLLAVFVALMVASLLIAVTVFAAEDSSIMLIVLEFLINLIANAVAAPILAAAVVVAYFDRRVRKEALDLDLVVNAMGGRPASEVLPRKRAPVVPAPAFGPPQPAWGGAPAGWGQPQAPPPAAPGAPAWGQPPPPPPAWGQPQPAPPQQWAPPAPPEPPPS